MSGSQSRHAHRPVGMACPHAALAIPKDHSYIVGWVLVQHTAAAGERGFALERGFVIWQG